jgi:cardiolipin synthase
LRLQAHGINVCEFNPVNPLRGRLFSLNNRDHRKILVVDGRIGFTGGINISSNYSSSLALRKTRSNLPWRDTHIELRGPAVRELQQLFVDSWRYQGCATLAGKAYFPPPQKEGNVLVRTLGSSPRDELNLIYIELLSALMHAEQSIHLTAAYFVPDEQTLSALKQAAGRGVDVKLVLPSFSDYSITFHAGRSYYSELLQAGIKIYERKGALLHAKTAIVDGVWSTVGSTNIDLRSFLYNDEINIVVLDKEFAQQMEALFTLDMTTAQAIDRISWEKRSGINKLKEGLARMLAPLL